MQSVQILVVLFNGIHLLAEPERLGGLKWKGNDIGCCFSFKYVFVYLNNHVAKCFSTYVHSVKFR